MSADAILALMRERWLPETKRGQYLLGCPSNIIAAHVVTVLLDAGFTIEGPAQDRGSFWTDERIAELLAHSRADRVAFGAPATEDEPDDEFAALKVGGLW